MYFADDNGGKNYTMYVLCVCFAADNGGGNYVLCVLQLISEAVPSARFDSKGLVEEVRLHFQELHSMLQAR